MKAHDPVGSAVPSVSKLHTVRATSIIGGAAMGNIAFGLVRMKVAAVILGPVGIGTIGLLQNLLNTAASIGSLNLGVAGAREIVASESSGQRKSAAARRAVLLATFALAVGSGLAFWLFRSQLAVLLFQDRDRGSDVGWLALGVAAVAGAGYQTAVLSAGRRIGDIARLNLLTAAIAALVGSICIVRWKDGGILPFILAAPVATLTLGWFFVRRATSGLMQSRAGPIAPHVISVVKLGGALTTSIFVSLCGQLAIRTLVERKLGAVALGHFQAAWTVTTVYLAFIFQTMANDYLPRLTAALTDRNQAQGLVESQAEVGFLLAAPILLAMIGGAPFILSLLYTGEFVEATTLLRLQMLGDMVRLAIWPVTLVLLAGGASREYAVTDIVGTAILVAMAAVLLPSLGLASAGIAYIIMNVVVGAAVMLIVYRRYSVVLGGRATRTFALLAASCGTTFLLTFLSVTAGALAGIAAASLWAGWAIFHLRPATAFERTKAN